MRIVGTASDTVKPGDSRSPPFVYSPYGGAMFVSQRFLGRLAKLRKTHREAPLAEQMDLVHDAFCGMLTGLPAQLVEEVYELVTDRIVERAENEASFIDEAQYLADVADLLTLQYDEENDPLHPDDWEIIGDLVNDYALDLDMETLNYVMKLVVDHHGV